MNCSDGLQSKWQARKWHHHLLLPPHAHRRHGQRQGLRRRGQRLFAPLRDGNGNLARLFIANPLQHAIRHQQQELMGWSDVQLSAELGLRDEAVRPAQGAESAWPMPNALASGGSWWEVPKQVPAPVRKVANRPGNGQFALQPPFIPWTHSSGSHNHFEDTVSEWARLVDPPFVQMEGKRRDSSRPSPNTVWSRWLPPDHLSRRPPCSWILLRSSSLSGLWSRVSWTALTGP